MRRRQIINEKIFELGRKVRDLEEIDFLDCKIDLEEIVRGHGRLEVRGGGGKVKEFRGKGRGKDERFDFECIIKSEEKSWREQRERPTG